MKSLFDKNGKITPSALAIFTKAIAKMNDKYANDEIVVLALSLPEYAKQKALELCECKIGLKELLKAFPDDEKLQNELMPLIFGKDEEK